MTKSRDFETLVARIEQILAPSGARITSPDHIADLVTGALREVDASIRLSVGSVDVLISVECRDRSRAEDVTWIEQLITKKASIGASHTIAVSSIGFSELATKLANRGGIGIRTISDVTDKTILEW